jgi:hypothetical protein
MRSNLAAICFCVNKALTWVVVAAVVYMVMNFYIFITLHFVDGIAMSVVQNHLFKAMGDIIGIVIALALKDYLKKKEVELDDPRNYKRNRYAPPHSFLK